MTDAPRIAVVGSVMADMMVALDRVPEGGETLPGNSFALGHGGKGANQAVMAALLGAEVSMVACVGADEFGDQALENFRRYGISTAGMRRLENVSTGVAPIWVDATGENRIVIVPGANQLMTVDQVEAAFTEGPMPSVVLCQLEIPTSCVHAALRRGADGGAVTILNPAPAADIAPETLGLATWLVPNEIEFARLAPPVIGQQTSGVLDDDICAFARVLGVGVAVTLGRAGVLVHDGRASAGPLRIPAPAVEATDTSGAGDAFVGAFGWALARAASPEEAAVFGCACAASSVQRRGTQASFPRGAELSSLKNDFAATRLGSSA